MTSSIIKDYFLPAPVWAVLKVYDYKTGGYTEKQDYNMAKLHLINTALAIYAFASSSRMKSVWGSQYDNLATLGSIFFLGATGQTLFAKTFVACVQGARHAVHQKNVNSVIGNIVMGVLACVLSSQGASVLYRNFIAEHITSKF